MSDQPTHKIPAVFGDYRVEIQQEMIAERYVSGLPAVWKYDEEGAVTIKITPQAGSTITDDPELLAAIILRDAWEGNE